MARQRCHEVLFIMETNNLFSMELNCVTAAASGCGHWIRLVCGLNAVKRPGMKERTYRGKKQRGKEKDGEQERKERIF